MLDNTQSIISALLVSISTSPISPIVPSRIVGKVVELVKALILERIENFVILLIVTCAQSSGMAKVTVCNPVVVYPFVPSVRSVRATHAVPL